MTHLADLQARMIRVARAMSASQAIVRTVGVLAILGVELACESPPFWVGMCLLAALYAAVVPEPHGMGVSVSVVVVVWLWTGRPAADPLTLATALALLTEHTCLVLAVAGPPSAAIGSTLVARAARRWAVVAGLTTLAWLAVGQLGTPSQVPVAVIALALALVGVGLIAATR